MPKQQLPSVPVWTIGTNSPETDRFRALLGDDTTLSPAGLAQLRNALATFADSPIVTLEAHPLPASHDLSPGRYLDAASPIARELGDLITRTAKNAPAGAKGSGEVLYRMVVPAKVAAKMGQGVARSMPSKAVANGVRSSVVSGGRIVAQASFVPVAAEAAGVTAATGLGVAASTGGAAAVGVTTAGLITVAAPLVLLAVATAITVHAERERQAAIEQITVMLEKLHQDKLDDELNELDGCLPAIERATAILLDRGELGVALGLDSAVHEIDKAVAAAKKRSTGWRHAIDAMSANRVEIEDVRKALPGIDKVNGEFRALLNLAGLATALKRRVIVLQAVQVAQSNEGNEFPRFIEVLKRDQRSLEALEDDLRSILHDLGQLRIKAPVKLAKTVMTRGDVDEHLSFYISLREVSELEGSMDSTPRDLEIEFAHKKDGSIIMMPARAIA